MKYSCVGEDSSDDEFMDPAGQFEIAGTGDDINVEEFGRYRQAKKLNQDANKDPNRKRMTRFFENDDDDDDGQDQGDQRDPKQGKGRKSKGKGKGKALKGDDADELGERRPTLTRLFDDNDNDKGSNKGSDKKARKSKLLMKDGVDSLEETETTVQVEYTLIKDPNKKKKKSKSKRKTKEDDRSSVASSSNKPSEPVKIPGLTAAESEKLAKTYDQALAASSADPAANAKSNLFVRRTSIATSYVDPETGQKMVDVQGNR
ncbi:unnamed protein product [Orchesella dallaii]|uniref:Uncharacterized protein n=1 Tax=Orchesella dallaii TaxID=48710 RepID=A0ABP1PRW2_9HEXA